MWSAVANAPVSPGHRDILLLALKEHECHSTEVSGESGLWEESKDRRY